MFLLGSRRVAYKMVGESKWPELDPGEDSLDEGKYSLLGRVTLS